MPIALARRTVLRRTAVRLSAAATAALLLAACTSSNTGSGDDPAPTAGSTAQVTTGPATAEQTASGSATDGGSTAGESTAGESPGAESPAGGSTSGESTTGESAGGSSTGGATAGVSAGFSVAGMVGQLPLGAVTDTVWVTVADLDAATEAAGLDRPTNPTDEREWLAAISGGASTSSSKTPVFVVPPDMFASFYDPAALERAIGWTLADATTFVSTSAAPSQFTVVTGDFDDSTLPSTLSEVGDGVVSFGDGEDLAIDPAGDRSVDNLGRPVRLAQQDGQIAVALSTPQVAGWLDGSAPRAETNPAIASVAEVLDNQNVLSAVIATPGDVNPMTVAGERAGAEASAHIAETLADNSISRPFDLIGIGWSVGENAGTRLVYHFPGGADHAEAARESVEHVLTEGTSLVTQQPVADLLQADSVTVEVSGDTVVATLAADDAIPGQRLVRMLQQRDVPFVYWNPDDEDAGGSGSAPVTSTGG